MAHGPDPALHAAVELGAELAGRSAGVFPGASLGEYNLPEAMAVVLARGEGAVVWDGAGRRFLDFTILPAGPGRGTARMLPAAYAPGLSLLAGFSWRPRAARS